ncbi:MAG: 30S ribosomal protein S8 [Dehalococcoidia bacterium]|nr:30S ribosomal protein S8 [Dehalococcoidia bacterium]
MSDPVADMLTRIRNAVEARHESTMVPASRLKIAVAKILRDEGFIKGYEVLRDGAQRSLKIQLRYVGRKEPILHGLQRVSKPGLRVYVQKAEIPRVYGGLGIAILTTPVGVMTGQQAWRKQVGGEILCYVW